MNVLKEINDALGLVRAQLKTAIVRHQAICAILEKDKTNVELRKSVAEAVQQVTRIGMEQKILFGRLRAHRESRTSEEEESRPESGSSSSNEVNMRESTSEDSIEIVSQPVCNYPEHMELADFMGYFRVGTHEFYDHMVKKRSLRKKSDAARPYFYMPVDRDQRKRQENKEKFLFRKVTTRKTKPKSRVTKRKTKK